MIKRIKLFIFITLILFPLMLFAKSKPDVEVNSTRLSIEHVEFRIENIQTQLDEIKDYKSSQEELIKQTTQTIINQNSVIDSFGVIYTLLTILLALLAVGLPILMYQFGIKPSKESLKDLEKNINDKVADYLKETRNTQIKKSIEQLKGNDDEIKGQAISFLSLTQHEGFTDQQLFQFYKLLKSDVLVETHKNVIANLLASRSNEYADELFSDKDQLRINVLKTVAYQYIAKVGLERFLDPLREYLSDTNDNQYGEFSSLLILFNLYSKSAVKEIMESQVLTNCLSEDTIQRLNVGLKSLLKNMNIEMSDFENTYLAGKLNLNKK